jgi:hypothetical protein
MQRQLDSVVSFKPDLYLFYIFLLILSQIIDLHPTLVGEDFRNFILANNYSILLLVAFDMLMGQLAKDREKLKRLSESIKKHMAEKQE